MQQKSWTVTEIIENVILSCSDDFISFHIFWEKVLNLSSSPFWPKRVRKECWKIKLIKTDFELTWKSMYHFRSRKMVQCKLASRCLHHRSHNMASTTVHLHISPIEFRPFHDRYCSNINGKLKNVQQQH